MTVKELKRQARKHLADIKKCLRQDGEWTSPRGNGVNSAEALEVAETFVALIEEVENG